MQDTICIEILSITAEFDMVISTRVVQPNALHFFYLNQFSSNRFSIFSKHILKLGFEFSELKKFYKYSHVKFTIWGH